MDAAAGSSGATIFPTMKKAKSHFIACSLDSNTNGQQSINPYVHFADTPAHFPMIEDDPNDVLEVSFSSGRGPAAVGGQEGGIIANLSQREILSSDELEKFNAFFVEKEEECIITLKEADLKRIRNAKIQQDMKDMEASLFRAKVEASLADGVSWRMRTPSK